MDRGAIEEKLRDGLDPGGAGRSGAKPAAAPAACPAGGRQRLPFGRLAVRLEERPGLEDARGVGEGADEVDVRCQMSELGVPISDICHLTSVICSCSTSVPLRLGTWPTGMVATSFRPATSIAD